MKLKYGVIRPTNEDDNFEVELIFKEVEGTSTLEILQQEVGGYIEHLGMYFPWLEQEGIDAWGNDEAALLELPTTCAIVFKEVPYPILLRGNIIFTRTTKDGDTVSLTKDDVIRITYDLYSSPKLFMVNPDDPKEHLKLFTQII